VIGVENQYIALFSIADKKDFIDEKMFKVFKCEESTGNILPIYELQFQSSDSELQKYLNEGNIIEVSIGRSLEDLEMTEFTIIKPVITTLGQNLFYFTLFGIYNALDYQNNRKLTFSDKTPSHSRIQQVVSPYFEFNNTVSASDSMAWLQPHISDKAFVQNIWLHSWINENTFPVIGITLDGQFRFFDFSKIFDNKPKWHFSFENKEEYIKYEGSPRYLSNSGILNTLQGYGRKSLIRVPETGKEEYITINPIQPFMSLSDSHNRSSLIEERYDEHKLQSLDNVHSNYHKARLHNEINLTSFSTNQIRIGVGRLQYKFKLLDLCFYKAEETNDESGIAESQTTGQYIITRVLRVFQNRTIFTYLDLVRDTFNSPIGGIR